MIPITQTRTGYGQGNCTESAIASLLEVPLEAVPDLWAGPHVPSEASDDEHQPDENLVRMWEWLKREHGVMLCGVLLLEATDLPTAWARACRVFPLPIETAEWARHHLAAGPNPDGVSHMVVCERGALAHDPNPGRRGIVSSRWVGWLVPLDLIPAEAREMPSADWLEQP